MLFCSGLFHDWPICSAGGLLAYRYQRDDPYRHIRPLPSAVALPDLASACGGTPLPLLLLASKVPGPTLQHCANALSCRPMGGGAAPVPTDRDGVPTVEGLRSWVAARVGTVPWYCRTGSWPPGWLAGWRL